MAATTPNVNKDNMENYTGNNNKTDLTDSNNYFDIFTYDFLNSLDELEELVATAGAVTVGRIIQNPKFGE